MKKLIFLLVILFCVKMADAQSFSLGANYTLNCIKVPVLVGVKLVKLGVANVRVMGGPAFTYMMGKKLDETSSSQLWPIKTKDDLKNSAWSAQVGAGVDILFLTLDVRYEFGITNLYKGDSDLKMKNNMFNVSLGVKLL